MLIVEICLIIMLIVMICGFLNLIKDQREEDYKKFKKRVKEESYNFEDGVVQKINIVLNLPRDQSINITKTTDEFRLFIHSIIRKYKTQEKIANMSRKLFDFNQRIICIEKPRTTDGFIRMVHNQGDDSEWLTFKELFYTNGEENTFYSLVKEQKVSEEISAITEARRERERSRPFFLFG
ncbi:MAG: hypothetical protein ACRC5M_04430 [Anaeroplasmataceae bacterium]